MFEASTLVVFQFHQSLMVDINQLALLLSDDEQAEVNKVKDDKQKHNFIVSRCFVRLLLSSFNHIPLSDITYIRSEFGKPAALDKQFSRLDVQFNVSHSNEVCFLAFGSRAKFGVDVEFIDSSINAEELASVYFSKDEQASLHSFKGEGLLNAFYSIWTLKEAYLKLTGVGLNVDLSQISTLTLMADNTVLLNKLDIDNQHYKAAIACDNSHYSVKLLTANESCTFIKPLLESALKG